MKITKEWLKEKSACDEGIIWFMGQKESEGLKVLSALVKSDHLQWANWLICRLMDKPNRVRYAIYAAELVLHIFEKKYPDDKRPYKAIEAAKTWLESPSDKTKTAAYAAAYAAYAAANAAAYAAAKKKMQLMILKYGMKLLGDK